MARSEAALRQRLSHNTRRKIALARVELRRASSMLRTFPGFLVIGTQRGGTSSLYRYLKGHPGLSPPLRKEVGYFSRDYSRGLGWYRAHFPLRGARPTFEATPDYLLDFRAPARAAQLLPEAKVLVMLRDPVERAWSHYKHMRRLGFETLGFTEAIEQEQERVRPDWERMAAEPRYRGTQAWRFSYFERGLYAQQLERWFARFSRSSVLVLRTEDFFADPGALYSQVLDFIGLEPWSPADFRNWSYASTRPAGEEMSMDMREKLQARFANPNRELYRLLGRDMRW